MTDTDKRIAEIDERWAKATPGLRSVIEGDSRVIVLCDGIPMVAIGNGEYWEKFTPQDLADAQATASAPEDIAYLRSVIDQQRDEIERLMQDSVDKARAWDTLVADKGEQL